MPRQEPVYEQLGLSLPPLEYLEWLEREKLKQKAEKKAENTVIEVEL
jgi:hypothetical protein|tara:strand:- start:18280 stop:18420 length:141 start_codon:yes stop_codon:yes gene_type:complete